MHMIFSVQRISKLFFSVLVIIGILSSPPIAHAADGSGTANIMTALYAGDTGVTLTLEYTAEDDITDGLIRYPIPAGWTDPQVAAGIGGKIEITTDDGILGRVENNMDSATGWSDNSLLIGVSSDTSEKQEGAASVRADVTLGLGTGRMYQNYGSAQDWSNYTNAGFWIRSNGLLSLGAVQLVVSESSNAPANSTTVSYPLPAIAADTWTYVNIDLTSEASSTRNAVLSYGLQVPLTLLNTYRIDGFVLGPSTEPTIVDRTIEIPIIRLDNGHRITIDYGAGGGTSGITVPTLADTWYLTDFCIRVSGTGTCEPASAFPMFTVKPAETAELYFIQQPGVISAGLLPAYANQFRIGAKDQYGNINTLDHSTLINMSVSEGPIGASLWGTTTKSMSAGVTAFSGITPMIAGSGYKFHFWPFETEITPLISDTYTVYGAVLEETSYSTNITEGGATDTYTVVLSQAPSSSVTVNINHDSQVTTSASSLTFTTGNWNTPQTVTVTAVDDSAVEYAHQGTIVHAVSSSDARYNATLLRDLTVTIADND